MAWCFEDECDRYSDNVLTELARSEAIVPGVWPLEVANVLLVAERRKRLEESDSNRFLSLLGELPIRVEAMTYDRTLDRLLALGRRAGLSSCDAAYLDLALRSGLPLATRDRRLRRACKKLGHTLFK
jgi:predicted nucleic acid-binding protein